jgi:hypothetical protein
MRKTCLLLAAAPLLLLSACANEQLGQEAPVCQRSPNEIEFTTGLVIQMQAVPDASFVPCIDTLQPGWKYEHVLAQNGRARFWLSSDRMGERFVEVGLQESCRVGPAAEPIFSRQEVDSHAEVDLIPSLISPVIIPVTDSGVNFSLLVKRVINAETLNGREPLASIDRRQVPLSDKIETAHAAGAPAIVIDGQDVLSGTASLILPGETTGRRGLAIYALIDRLDAKVPQASYTGTWYHVFEGGCITYEFNASGNEVDTLARDITAAVGFLDANFARRILRDAGILE